MAACIATGVGLRAISKGVEVPPNPTAMKAAHHVATHGVRGQPPSPFGLWRAREVSSLSGRSSIERRIKAIVAKCPGHGEGPNTKKGVDSHEPRYAMNPNGGA
jgi:hypothetical protein